MKRVVCFASALALMIAAANVARGWIQFLDGSTLPDPPWQFYQDGGTEGETLVVDFFDGRRREEGQFAVVRIRNTQGSRLAQPLGVRTNGLVSLAQ